ncbi:phage integrase SAM-like domain-containing protein, partial [Bacteroides pyogenes]
MNSFILFMRQVAGELQHSGNQGTAHVYRSSLNAIVAFQGGEPLGFRDITPEWLKKFEISLRARGCSWNTVSTYLRTL